MKGQHAAPAQLAGRARTVSITLELDPVHAAALKRFAEKISFSEALAITYGHHAQDERQARAYEVIAAFLKLEEALADAGARGWPWIETGSAD